MSLAICKQCRKTMTHIEFDQHDCPNSPGKPLDGESFPDYKARCDKWRKDRVLGTVAGAK